MSSPTPTQGTPGPSKSTAAAHEAPQEARIEEVLSTCPKELRDRYRPYATAVVTRKDAPRTKAIRLKCLECCAWQLAEVSRCHLEGCALHQYRSGGTAEVVE